MKIIEKTKIFEGNPIELREFYNQDVKEPVVIKQKDIKPARKIMNYKKWDQKSLYTVDKLNRLGMNPSHIGRQIGRTKSSVLNAIRKLRLGIYRA